MVMMSTHHPADDIYFWLSQDCCCQFWFEINFASAK